MAGKTWSSPDGKIRKVVVLEGDWGKKPYELSECEIKISNFSGPGLETPNNSVLVIGDNDGDFGRFLDLCLITMNENETSNFTIVPKDISFTVHLIKITHNGLIYQWDAGKKMEIALKHKAIGVELFKENKNKDAVYRFTKALKIISSIPIDVQKRPNEIDGVPLVEIENLKANLFNNLASYHLKEQTWCMVINLCLKVLKFDPDNVKAHYKCGVAHMREKNFDKAEKAFEIVLSHEPGNKAALENLKLVKEEILKGNVKCDNLVKKMFQ